MSADVVPSRSFWRGQRVLLTGHTGFKGSWLTLWLRELGAEVIGYSKDIPTSPSCFEAWRLAEVVQDIRADLADFKKLKDVLLRTKPTIVMHLAAQPLVLEAYRTPLETFQDNLQGTLHLLEALRVTESVRVLVNVTTDKVYENREWPWGFRETDPLGGDDPYSASKACSELVTRSYYRSFLADRKIAVVTCRAGNVVGGGDWGTHRLLPDAVRACLQREPLRLRHPKATRPWQHVIDALRGYLLAAEAAHRGLDESGEFFRSWNFGPSAEDLCSVHEVIERFGAELGDSLGHRLTWEVVDSREKEANALRLDAGLARKELGWKARLRLDETLRATAANYLFLVREPAKARDFAHEQIRVWGMNELA